MDIGKLVRNIIGMLVRRLNSEILSWLVLWFVLTIILGSAVKGKHKGTDTV